MVLLRNVKLVQRQLYIGVNSKFYTFSLLNGQELFFFGISMLILAMDSVHCTVC
jgi:hypothetical protein